MNKNEEMMVKRSSVIDARLQRIVHCIKRLEERTETDDQVQIDKYVQEQVDLSFEKEYLARKLHQAGVTNG